jgi:hypothetical protein
MGNSTKRQKFQKCALVLRAVSAHHAPSSSKLARWMLRALAIAVAPKHMGGTPRSIGVATHDRPSGFLGPPPLQKAGLVAREVYWHLRNRSAGILGMAGSA